jgi:hypothetical protein
MGTYRQEEKAMDYTVAERQRRWRQRQRQRQYATRRMSDAVDRLIVATTDEERMRARYWIEGWRRAAGIKQEAAS